MRIIEIKWSLLIDCLVYKYVISLECCNSKIYVWNYKGLEKIFGWVLKIIRGIFCKIKLFK